MQKKQGNKPTTDETNCYNKPTTIIEVKSKSANRARLLRVALILVLGSGLLGAVIYILVVASH